MGTVVEVIFKRRVANHKINDIAHFDDEKQAVLLRALIVGGHVDVLNPPDWTLDGRESDEVFLYRQPTKTVEPVQEVKPPQEEVKPPQKETPKPVQRAQTSPPPVAPAVPTRRPKPRN